MAKHILISIVCASIIWQNCNIYAQDIIMKSKIKNKSAVSNRTQQMNCIAISECAPYVNMLKNKHLFKDIPGLDFNQVLEEINRQSCDGNPQMVNCPEENINEEEDEDDGELHIFDDFARPEDECSGSLAVLHTPKRIDFNKLRTLRLTRQSYRRLQKLQKRQIIQVEVQGDCCWEIYARNFFKGNSQILDGGFRSVPHMPLKSVKRVDC